MNRSRIIRKLGAFLAATLLAAIAAPAQTAPTQNPAPVFIKGTVSAENGDPIRDATVVLEEKTRSESVETKTDYGGRFSFSGLKAGTYVLRAKLKGFPDAATHPMKLSAGESKEVDLELRSPPVHHPLPPGPMTPAPSVTQAGPPQNIAAVFIKGTVRDQSGAQVPGATVILEEKTRAESVEGKTLADGTFSFLAMKGGTYVVRVRMAGFRQFATEPMQLSPGDKKQLDLVLEVGHGGGVEVIPPPAESSSDAGKTNSSAAEADKKPQASKSDLKVRPPTQEKSDTMEFSDAPNFTVAGVTDWSNAGLHASETNARTSESLNKDMASLKKDDAPASAKAPAANEADTHRAAGDHYEAAGDALAAEREYEAAVRLDPSEANYFAWGTELLVHKAIQPAVEVFTKGAGAHPESWRMLVGLGAALYASGSYEDAARRVCQASDLQPADAVPYLFLGKMQKSATDSLPCVEEKLARFLRAQPENAQANYYYAVALWKHARGAESPADLRKQEALLQKAVRADSKLAEAYLQLGILYEAQNGWELAVRVYKQAIAANPQLGEAHYRLGLAYKRAGDQTKAAQEFALYKQAQEAQTAAEEQQRKELQQFVVILKEKDKKKD